MDIVRASLIRQTGLQGPPAGEVAEVLGTLWAHARPEDGLEHASGRAEHGHVSLVMYLLSFKPTACGSRSATHRAGSLLQRCYAASPLMRRRYLPPDIPA